MFHESGKFDKISLVTLIIIRGKPATVTHTGLNSNLQCKKNKNFLIKVVRTKAKELIKISFKLEHKINLLSLAGGSY
jgi:hypothetical protein